MQCFCNSHSYEIVPGSYLKISVTDNGCGIPEHDHTRIFDPFFTTARSTGGTGLGLHVVYNMVTHKLKGTIKCQSEEGIGTTFIITLPLTIVN